MALPFRPAALAAALALLGGCQTTFDLVGVTIPLQISETRHWNGSYQGSVEQAVASGPGCPTEHGERVLMVGDDVVWYAYTPVTFFAAPIRYDGSIETTSGATKMTGQITGDDLNLLVKSATCETRITMHYIYNRS